MKGSIESTAENRQSAAADKSLLPKEYLMVASMLFGMFFGAGNLIFPIHMGQLAGRNLAPALIGFIVTGVGLPVLGVAALGSSRSSGLNEMASRVGKGYGIFFTCALYLTIGPFFAIPRCASTAFTVGFPAFSDNRLLLLLFSAVFFLVTLLFSLKPGKIMVWIGKYLNPVFLILFGALIFTALLHPAAAISFVEPDSAYASGAFFQGFLEGYNTMDALAGLAFGIVVVDSLRKLGQTAPDAIAASTVRSGLVCAVLMAVIYCGACVIGAQSRGIFETSENGGIALAQISGFYFGRAGQVLLAAIVTLACMKTAIGLITSISETFSQMFTQGKYYRVWAGGFCLFSFVVSNAGLSALIRFSGPVLSFLYPLAITLILLNLTGRFFGNDRRVYLSVTILTMCAAFFDFFNGLGITAFNSFAARYLPFYSLGFGWTVPAAAGLVIGLVLKHVNFYTLGLSQSGSLTQNKKQNNDYSPMPLIMAAVLIGSILLCGLFAMLYQLKNQSWMLSCAITFGVTAYHFLIRFLSPVLIIALSHKKYDCGSRWFREKEWEPRLYSFLRVKKWKSKAAIFTYDPREFSSQLHSYPEIVNNMCHAEAVHELIVLLSFTSLLFAVPFGAFPVFFITAVLAALMDLQFVILQRYNRPRVIRLMERNAHAK